MAYRTDDNSGDIIIDGFEQGISPSPYNGIANIQGGNISTELGEVSVSFNRVKQSQTPIAAGTLTASVADGTTLFDASPNVNAGQWITLSSNTITITPNYLVSVLVQAGGAGGGGADASGYSGGGGAAGGYKTDTAYAVNPGAYAVVIGNGGAAGAVGGGAGGVGSDSAFDTITSTGGGKGGGDQGTPVAAGNGGSGGGGYGNGGTGGTGTVGQGHNGGNGVGDTVDAGGGGGGSSTAGGNGTGGGVDSGGNGGAGTVNTISGVSVTYGSGGSGAGTTAGTVTSGGGIGGAANTAGTAGTANTGGGGGGGQGGAAGKAGGAGGSGVVVVRYITGALTATGGTISTDGIYTVHKFTSSGTFTVTAQTTFFVSYKDTNGKIKLSAHYDPLAASPVTHGTSGTATFVTTDMGNPLAKATEIYGDGTQQQYRYYVLDSKGLVWVYDTSVYAATLLASGVGTTWMLPDTSITYFGSDTTPSGIGILQGWLFAISGGTIWGKPTTNLGDQTTNATTWVNAQVNYPGSAGPMPMNSPPGSYNPHFAFTGHQGRMYITDGNYLVSIFPDTSIQTGAANMQSFCQYTAATTTGTVAAVIAGSMPILFDSSFNIIRVPVVFFPAPGGSLPTALTANVVYWVSGLGDSSTFTVYAAASGGAALDIQTGSVGTQYFNTFWVRGTHATASGDDSTTTYSQQRVNLPSFETAKCLVEIGNTVLIGCLGNIVYPWNQVDVTPSSLIALPESNVASMITVNQMAYIFAGNKANVYITDGSVASLVIKVPDYCAGVPGSPATYIEPSFTWKDAAYIRGRVYFSILDQTTTKSGNCGGVWSFVPTQNLYIGQDTGVALRLENQNSYATYNGAATLIIPNQVQNASQPLFWSAWYSSVTAPTYGIDYSNNGTSASFTLIIETDMIPAGTFLNNKTFQQLEYKLATALDAGATITANYRSDPTAAWASAFSGSFITDTAKIGAYAPVGFEQSQWVQFQLIVTPVTSTASTNTFCRVRELRLR